MSAISFSTKVEKETDDKGDWAVITLRGKWYAESFFHSPPGAPSYASSLISITFAIYVLIALQAAILAILIVWNRDLGGLTYCFLKHVGTLGYHVIHAGSTQCTYFVI